MHNYRLNEMLFFYTLGGVKSDIFKKIVMQYRP